jgi:hypothetical protein
MTPSAQGAAYAGERKCPFCGKPVRGGLTQCPFCREAIPQVGPISRGNPLEGRRKIRQGLLYMLLALIVYYFASGHSRLQLPVQVPPIVAQYLTWLLFLGGAGMVVYGYYLKVRS